MIPALIVPILTRPDLLDRMLASIDVEVERIIIIDNGRCVDRRLDAIRMPANLGVAGSWNLGIKAAPMAPWWLIVNFDCTFPPGSLQVIEQAARTDAVMLTDCSPPWSCFTIGEDVVRKVGLFDERFHPAYFEDDDYAWRCQQAGVEVGNSGAKVDHDNSSTLSAGYQHKNDQSFSVNAIHWAFKKDRGDTTAGWDLDRRRINSWD